jgi:apolipoprotein D and lipocalin family protein
MMFHLPRTESSTTRTSASRTVRGVGRHHFFGALGVLGVMALAACGEESTTERLGLDPPPTVSGLSLDRYDGQWYEIGSYPNSFQAGCSNTTATYTAREDGDVDVLNECIVDGSDTVANGVARIVDLDAGKLEVSFFGPFYGDYWVLEVGEDNGSDADYTHAVVAGPSRDYLWVLSRTPTLPTATMNGIIERTEALSFDFDRFEYTTQDGD